MKMAGASAALLATLLATSACGAAANPLGKVIDLMNELKGKVVKDGEDEQKAYHDYYEWCDDASKNAMFALETAETKKEKLTAEIASLTSSTEASSAKIEELAGVVASSEAELKDATLIRDKEAVQFAKAEEQLAETCDTLKRAIGILEKEMAKNPAAFAQVDASSMSGLLGALNALVDAAALSGSDHQKLVALVQSQQGDDDDDDAPGAPASTVYKTHSGNILDVLEDMMEKAEAELKELRKAEGAAKHNYEMLKQSLDNEASVNTKHMDEEKAAKAEDEESKATAEGDLKMTEDTLKNGKDELASIQASCMTVAADHEASIAARQGELKVIAEATKILMDTTSGAVEQTYALLQVTSKSKTESRMASHATLANMEVAHFVKSLAKKHRSAALAQLASRISSIIRFGDDPFTKVKSLITDMIAKLEAEAAAAATEKAWCDEQFEKTEAKVSELEEDVAKLSTKIDKAAARSAELKASTKALQEELAKLAKEQAEMDQIRAEENAAYTEAKSDLEEGIEGVRKALEVLRNYYGSSAALLQSDAVQPAKPVSHSKATGAGESIIGILEVVESDFATNLAKTETEEADAASEYEKVTQENKVTKTKLDQDVKYQTQEFTSLDKAIDELSADKDSTDAELASVNEYLAGVKDRCIAKPETYEERQAKRQSEIEGLKQALSILENETAFMQKRRRSKNMRGALVAA